MHAWIECSLGSRSLAMVILTAPPEVEGVVVSHQGVVFLDSVAGRSVLTNIRTRAKKILPDGTWELVHGENGGDSMLVRLAEGSDEGELYEIADFLKKVLYETSAGDAIVQGSGRTTRRSRALLIGRPSWLVTSSRR